LNFNGLVPTILNNTPLLSKFQGQKQYTYIYLHIWNIFLNNKICKKLITFSGPN